MLENSLLGNRRRVGFFPRFPSWHWDQYSHLWSIWKLQNFHVIICTLTESGKDFFFSFFFWVTACPHLNVCPLGTRCKNLNPKQKWYSANNKGLIVFIQRTYWRQAENHVLTCNYRQMDRLILHLHSLPLCWHLCKRKAFPCSVM